MTILKKIVISLIILIAASLICFVGCSSDTNTTSPTVGPRVGMTAPDFKFKDTSDKIVSLSDLRGKPAVLNFWAVWCDSCKVERPIFQGLADDGMVASGGLILITINCGDSAETVSDFMLEYGYSFPVLLDVTKNIMSAYNARYIPTTFFIGPDGIISEVKTGPFIEKSQLDQIIKTLIP